MVISFSDKLEGMIKASVVQQKLSRLEVGLDFYIDQMSPAQAAKKQAEAERIRRALKSLRTSSGTARSKQEHARLAKFHPSDISDTQTFLRSGTVTGLMMRVVSALRSSMHVTDHDLLSAMLTCACRLLYW